MTSSRDRDRPAVAELRTVPEGKGATRRKAADPQQAYELKLRGGSWWQVAQQSGYASADSARQAVRIYRQKAQLQLDRHSLGEALEVELDRLDVWARACATAAEAGELAAIGMQLRISAHRARLLGWDAYTALSVVVERQGQSADGAALHLPLAGGGEDAAGGQPHAAAAGAGGSRR